MSSKDKTVTIALFHRVAHSVARAWLYRIPVTTYGYDDIYQDAIEVMCQWVSKHDPEKGPLEQYLRAVASRHTGQRLTRGRQVVGTRSNSEVVNLRHLKSVELPNDDDGSWASDIDYDHIVWLTKVRERMIALADNDRHALSIALGLTTAAELTSDKEEARKLHQRVRLVKGRILKDKLLYRMLREQRNV